MASPFLPRKTEFCLEKADLESPEVCSLRSGTQLSATLVDDYAEFRNSDGAVVGTASSTELNGFENLAAVDCRVRTLRRNCEGKVSEVVVRVSERRGSAVVSFPGSREGGCLQEEGDEEGWRVKQPQFELLVSNEGLRNVLRDARLEKDLRAIDGAKDREKALDAALQNPDFKGFAEKLLDAIHPQ